MKKGTLIVFSIVIIALIITSFSGNFPESATYEIERSANAAHLVNNTPAIAETEFDISAGANSIIIGNKAPEISLKNPEDSIIRLSSLMGQLVLIDFWASWCGPCRKENPTVVAAYNKYKSLKFEDGNTNGFTVFSISLDKDKHAWIYAISKDGLTWPNHVSDLNVWNSEIAREYGVTMIPANFLINRDGIVIATNLRGSDLEAKLASLVHQ